MLNNAKKDKTAIPCNEWNLWLNGGQTATIIFATNTYLISDCQRVPVIIGGNISNVPFLRLYDIDFYTVGETLTKQTNFKDIIPPCVEFDLFANANAGNTTQHRMRITAPDGAGMKIFIKEFNNCYLGYYDVV